MKASAKVGKVIVKLKLTNYVDEQLQKLKLLKGKPRSVAFDTDVGSASLRW